jgi:hypothetical protein
MLPRSVISATLIALLGCLGEVRAAIEFVDAAAGDYRILLVSDVRLDGIDYTATFSHNISGDDWLLENPRGPTITGHQEAMLVADVINESIASANIDAQSGTNYTRNAYLPYTADQPFPAAMFSSLLSPSPLRYEIGSSSLPVRGIGKYPEWAIVSFKPQSMQELPGDINADGVVDAADYTTWRDQDGATVAYQEWRENYGRSLADLTPPSVATLPSDTQPAPEPTGVLLACLASMGVSPQRRLRCTPDAKR